MKMKLYHAVITLEGEVVAESYIKAKSREEAILKAMSLKMKPDEREWPEGYRPTLHIEVNTVQ